MKKTFVLGFVSLMALLMILSGCTNAVGQAGETALRRNINANSCNADKLCEMNSAQAGEIRISGNTISTIPNSASKMLYLQSDDSAVVVSGPIQLKDDVIAERNVLISGPLELKGGVFIKGKTISTSPGNTSDLILTSDNKNVVIDGRLKYQQKCEKFAGESIEYDKSGYENCRIKGLNNLCLIERFSAVSVYDGLDCKFDLNFYDRVTSLEACSNNPSPYTYSCRSPLDNVTGSPKGSESTAYEDSLICCG